MASGNNPTGRSPFPTRRTRMVRPSIESTASDMVGADHHSPHLPGLMRHSPNNTGNQSGHWSPHPNRWSTRNSTSRTFFGANSTNAAASTPVNSKTKTPTQHNTNQAGANHQQEDPSQVVDGLPLDQLRSLARESLHNSHYNTTQQACFYASILYAKTSSHEDTLLYARTLMQVKNYTACLKLLENSNMLQSSLPWPGLLIACAALAAQNEWASVVSLLEDACRLPDDENNTNTFGSNRMLSDDQDEFRWQELAQHIWRQQSSHDDGNIHWLAHICAWRGRAYHETGHNTRAAKFWKRALQLDGRHQESWECLMDLHLLSPQDAHSFLQSCSNIPAWLKALYMARLELAPAFNKIASQEKDTADGNTPPVHPGVDSTYASKTVPDASFASFGLDASAIPSLTSPGAFSTPLQSGAGLTQTSTAAVAASATATAESQKMMQDVNAAFERLWNEHKLQQSPAVLAMAARRALKQYDWGRALELCELLAARDPAVTGAAFVYVAVLTHLGRKQDLFQLAHHWVEADPRSAQSWFAVGAYYYACERYHIAQRHFCRATRLDSTCSEAWIAFGCSFAACNESDQALASFRAAQRQAPGDHMSLLYLGTEYIRTNHLVLAHYFLSSAISSSGGSDALCLHEMGVLQMHRNETASAIGWFQRALIAAAACGIKNRRDHDIATVEEAVDILQDPHWEPTVFNLGHCYRKSHQFEKAEMCFRRCVAMAPENASTYAALAFTKHLVHDLDEAIDYYHQALSVKADDPFATEMLQRALQEQSAKWSGGEEADKFEPVIGESVMSVKGVDESSMSMDVDMSESKASP